MILQGTGWGKNPTEMEQRHVVFLIDDDIIYQSITSMLIERVFKPIDFYPYNNGQEALEVIKSNSQNHDLLPSLILLDINMPIMDGWKFLDELSVMLPDMVKQPRISMMSSSSLEEDVNRAMNFTPVVEFVTKPLTIEHLQRLTEDF